MFALFKNEMKVSFKQLLIWSFSVGIMGLLCIVLYKSMQESMAGMAENFAAMGSFSEAFGMDKLSIATLKGFFATEIGTIHSLGSAMFAAAMATVILSKEEDGHTAEFTYTLPVSRGKIVAVKFLSVLVNLVVFTVICLVLYQIGFVYIGADDMGREFYLFMLAQLMMNVEIASICFVISAYSKKNKLGIGIALAMFLYFFDLIARVIPDMKDLIRLTPLSYANATDIFSEAGGQTGPVIIGICVTLTLTAASALYYCKRDLAS